MCGCQNAATSYTAIACAVVNQQFCNVATPEGAVHAQAPQHCVRHQRALLLQACKHRYYCCAAPSLAKTGEDFLLYTQHCCSLAQRQADYSSYGSITPTAPQHVPHVLCMRCAVLWLHCSAGGAAAQRLRAPAAPRASAHQRQHTAAHGMPQRSDRTAAQGPVLVGGGPG